MKNIFNKYLLRDPHSYELEIYKNMNTETIVSDILKTVEYSDILKYKVDYNYYYSNNFLGFGFKQNIIEIKKKFYTINEFLHKKSVDKEAKYKSFATFLENEYTTYIQHINSNNKNTIHNYHIIKLIKTCIVYILNSMYTNGTHNTNSTHNKYTLQDSLESLYHKLTYEYNTIQFNIAVLIHVGNYAIFNIIKSYLNNLDELCNYDLYINLAIYGDNRDNENENIKTEILNYKPNAIITQYENIGMDIGPFLKQIKYIKEINKSYGFVLKLHTKTKNKWRNELIDPLLANREYIKNYLIRAQNDTNVGMICCKKWLLKMDNLNNYILSNLLKKYGLVYNRECKFVGGTIFWVKWDILNSFFTFNKIDELYSHLERGYSQNFRPTLVHSMERLLGIIIINYKQRYLEL